MNRELKVDVRLDQNGPIYYTPWSSIPGFTAWGNSYPEIVQRIHASAGELVQKNGHFLNPPLDSNENLTTAIIIIRDRNQPGRNVSFKIGGSLPSVPTAG